jgi:hypothetical protein
VWSCGVRKRLGGRPVVSHICQKRADMGHPALVAGMEPKARSFKNETWATNSKSGGRSLFFDRRSHGLRPTQGNENGSCSATTVHGSEASWRELRFLSRYSRPEACALGRKRFVQLYRMSLFCSANRRSALAPSPSRSSLRHMLVRWFSTVR